MEAANDQLLEGSTSDLISESPTNLQTLEDVISQTLNQVNNQIPVKLLLLLENNLTGNDFSKLPQQVLESTVKDAIQQQQANVDLENWTLFDQQIRQKCEDTWLPTLETLVKHTSSYNESLKIKLDLYRCMPTKEYTQFSQQLLQKVVSQIKEPLPPEILTNVCNKIAKIYGEINEWMLENKLGLENQINEIVDQYDNEITSFEISSSGNGSLLDHHSKLKRKYVEQLQNKFEGVKELPLAKRILVGYELQLCGLLNASFDRNARQRKCIPKPISDITGDTLDGPDERRQGLSAKRPISTESDEASKSTKYKRRMKGSFTSIDSILVRMKGEIKNVTKVGNTPIRYLKNKIISSGTTATVYYGFCGDGTGRYREAAVKKFQEQNLHIYYNEMEVWQQIDAVNNPMNYNVVSLLSQGTWDGDLFLATELAESDLSKRIQQLRDENRTNYNQLISYIYDISKGLYWLHSRQVLHRDIKPENVLIFKYDFDGTTQEIAKLTDFGISRVVNKDNIGKDTHAAGTDDWSSPEVLEAKYQGTTFNNTRSQDIFSLGLTFYYTLTLGVHPFDYSELGKCVKYWNIKDKQLSPLKLADNPLADNVIQQMLDRIPQNRPNVREILKHPIFWKTETKLAFIREFSEAIGENKNEEAQKIRYDLDKDYLKEHEDRTNGESEFNWLAELDDVKRDAINRRKNSTKIYQNDHNGDSITSLVKLIRDKYAHRKDLVDELLKDEHFGTSGQFDEEKYANYFLETFPNLLLFLIKSLSRFNEFENLYDKYFL